MESLECSCPSLIILLQSLCDTGRPLDLCGHDISTEASADRRSDATLFFIAVFPILAEVVEVKTVSWSTAHWRIHFIRLNGWLRHSFAQFITLLDIDGTGQNWEDNNINASRAQGREEGASVPCRPPARDNELLCDRLRFPQLRGRHLGPQLSSYPASCSFLDVSDHESSVPTRTHGEAMSACGSNCVRLCVVSQQRSRPKTVVTPDALSARF